MKEKIPQSELILKQEVRHLLDDFAALMKLRAVFFNPAGCEIERGRDADCSPYCRCMQKRFGLSACSALDALKREEAKKNGKILSYVCHAGLGEIIAPVKLFDSAAGFIVMGQFRVTEALPDFPLSGEEEVCYRALPLINGEELRNLEHMVQMLLEYIVSKELVSYPQDLRMVRLRQYIERHLAEKITLAKAARAAGCSESTLTHYLRAQYHLSFCELLLKKRLETAEKLLKTEPDMPLSAIAEAAGFQTLNYFARVFKKKRGTTPGRFRRDSTFALTLP